MLDKNKAKQKISVKSKNGLGISILQLVLNYFGLRMTYFCLLFVVPYYFILSFAARRASSQFWKIIRPEYPFYKRQFYQFKQLYIFAQILVDRAFQKNTDHFKFEIVEGKGVSTFVKKIEGNTSLNSGHVIIQSHVGGWEIAMSYFKRLRFDKKLMAVMYGVEGSYQHTSVNENEKNVQVTHFNMQNDTVMKLKENLNKGNIVGLMGDRPVGRSYELVPFFGKLALFDTSAVRLALLCQSQIHLLFCFKLDEKKYFVEAISLDLFNDPLLLAKGRDEKVNAILKIYVQSLEENLKKHPEQWFNFFPFWSETIF